MFDEEEKIVHLKELNEGAELKGCKEVNPNKIRTIINFWAIKNWIKRHNDNYSRNHITVKYTQPKEIIQDKLTKRHELAQFIVNYLYLKSRENT